MKIIGVQSSPHRHGSTAQLLQEALKGARDGGAETELIYLPDQNIQFCVGCQQCLASDGCAINDDINALRDKILQADGVILASPTYEADMNAMMKNFLDRILPYTCYRSAFRSKYVAAISTAGGFGAKTAAKRMTIIRMGFHKQGIVSGTLGAIVGFGDVQSYLNKAYHLGNKMTLDIKKQKKYPLQMLSEKIMFNLFLRRIMSKNIIEHREGKRKSVYQYLKREGLLRKDPMSSTSA